MELSGRWSVPRLIPLPPVPCPASRRAWYNLVKCQAQEPQKQVFGDDAQLLAAQLAHVLARGLRHTCNTCTVGLPARGGSVHSFLEAIRKVGLALQFP